MISTSRRLIAAATLFAALTFSVSAAPKEETLYKRLGGKKAITAVVDEFVGRVAGDNRTNASSETPHPTPPASRASR